MRVAVAGGTGTVGRWAVDAARRRGHDTTVLARSAGVDVLRGTNLDEALAGIDVVIDALNTPALSTAAAVEFFRTVTRRLLDVEERAGAKHHVALSIVGIDRIDASYYAGKLAQERLVEASALPHTIARTAQFHEFAEQIARRTTLGRLTVAPRILSRPVAAREVGEHLVSIAEAAPSGRARDLVGPRDEKVADLVRRLYAHDGVRRKVLELRLPGAYGKGLASGDLRGPDDAARAQTTFDTWLATDHRPS